MDAVKIPYECVPAPEARACIHTISIQYIFQVELMGKEKYFEFMRRKTADGMIVTFKFLTFVRDCGFAYTRRLKNVS